VRQQGWQERHLALPKYRCEVKGCLAPARHRVLDRTARPHLACDGHLDVVALRFMRADDCLMVEA